MLLSEDIVRLLSGLVRPTLTHSLNQMHVQVLHLPLLAVALMAQLFKVMVKIML